MLLEWVLVPLTPSLPCSGSLAPSWVALRDYRQSSLRSNVEEVASDFRPSIVFAPTGLFAFPFGMWIWVACEEGLKAFASTREERPTNKFWLVTLFGTWELALSKPIWGLVLAESGEAWDRLALAGLLYATALPVLMHTVTAAIYAFTFQKRLWVALVASWTIHTAFNEAALYFYPSPIAVVVETLLLSAILAFILTRLTTADRRNPGPKSPELGTN